ncbi:hypothetical protein [Enterovibrio nigricans]|uniref:Uncharacterized protein n=1 Tax=Enterovibrio nigricans DSM 22720 TaxID=1121868 RepID=A0A1T4TVY5_9GAMM|nr:hypothetical protein [Enterovibrio nigricans]PKF50835.1 hypothetical protein AT251_08535 [Enterovibrio nigricans]SKA44622.1 hypothetical protein SAMN02745132_00203 [Enterovibrio nigricans DSM 22720]
MLRFDKTVVEWGLISIVIGILGIAAIPLFDRVVDYADDVEFRYLANAFAGSVKNVQMRATLQPIDRQHDMVSLDGVSFRLTHQNDKQAGHPFALKDGALTLQSLSSKDCGALFSALTGQSYWLDNDSRPKAFTRIQPTVRAIVAKDKGISASPYCRFERPVRAGFWGDDSSATLARHVFAYYPASGRVELLSKTGEVK